MAFAENKIDVLKKIKASKSFEDLEKLRLYYLGKKGGLYYRSSKGSRIYI